MACYLWIVKVTSNIPFFAPFPLIKLTREITAFLFSLEALSPPDHAQRVHGSTNAVTGSLQSQNLSDLSCIPWSSLKPDLGTTDMGVPCAGACALPGISQALP